MFTSIPRWSNLLKREKEIHNLTGENQIKSKKSEKNILNKSENPMTKKTKS